MPLLVVGLTGNIASGKSMVRAIFAELGDETLDADAVVRTLYEPGGPATGPLVEAFGSDILAEDGSIDRPRLAARTMGNREATLRLETIVHPLVQAAIDEWIAAARRRAGSSPALAIVEASLTFEAGTERRHDVMVVVDAPIDLRRSRAARRGVPPEEFDRREERMMPAEEKRRRADLVVCNDASEEILRREVLRIRDLLLERASRERAAGERSSSTNRRS